MNVYKTIKLILGKRIHKNIKIQTFCFSKYEQQTQQITEGGFILIIKATPHLSPTNMLISILFCFASLSTQYWFFILFPSPNICQTIHLVFPVIFVYFLTFFLFSFHLSNSTYSWYHLPYISMYFLMHFSSSFDMYMFNESWLCIGHN